MNQLYTRQRKPLTIASFFLLGLTCLNIGLLTKLAAEKTVTITVLFVIGKLLASIAATITYMIVAESFPTECRLLGTSKSYSRLYCRWYAVSGYMSGINSRHSFLITNNSNGLQMDNSPDFWLYGNNIFICGLQFARQKH